MRGRGCRMEGSRLCLQVEKSQLSFEEGGRKGMRHTLAQNVLEHIDRPAHNHRSNAQPLLVLISCACPASDRPDRCSLLASESASVENGEKGKKDGTGGEGTSYGVWKGGQNVSTLLAREEREGAHRT